MREEIKRGRRKEKEGTGREKERYGRRREAREEIKRGDKWEGR